VKVKDEEKPSAGMNRERAVEVCREGGVKRNAGSYLLGRNSQKAG